MLTKVFFVSIKGEQKESITNYLAQLSITVNLTESRVHLSVLG